MRLEKLKEYSDETTAWYWCPSSQDSLELLTILTLMRTLTFGRGWLIMKEVVVARPGLLVG
jgi:hypothetical protein